jgi:hypothetical protein
LKTKQKYHTVGTVPKSSRKIVEIEGKLYLDYTHTVHGHKYSSPSIFYYIFHIKPHLFKNNISKLSLGRFL